MIRIQTASRLHFGLLSLPGPGCWPDRAGAAIVPARRFGGVGLMVEAPGLRLSVRPAAAWGAAGPLAGRALGFARSFAATLPEGAVAPQQLVVEQAPPEHAGLGTGTQLGLAVARALALTAGCGDLTAAELAARAGRGVRSALGVHGFAQGGFLVEAGKGVGEALAPLVARLPFPEDWRVVLALPGGAAGLHGVAESAAFDRLGDRLAATDALCRLVLLGLLPALVEQNVAAFGEALYDFNARVGDLFAPVQGGTYVDRRVGELVTFVRGQGVRGVGQSSWGPAVFAVTADPDRAADLAERLRRRFHLGTGEAFVTCACNRGACAQTAAD